MWAWAHPTTQSRPTIWPALLLFSLITLLRKLGRSHKTTTEVFEFMRGFACLLLLLLLLEKCYDNVIQRFPHHF